MHLHAGAHLVSGVSTSTTKKPFRNVWMTHDRPTGWSHLSPRSGWSALPTSFAAKAFHPVGTLWVASVAPPADRDTLTELNVIRC
jgi:hypothetical protein